jgi:hypothetical protein
VTQTEVKQIEECKQSEPNKTQVEEKPIEIAKDSSN